VQKAICEDAEQFEVIRPADRQRRPISRQLGSAKKSVMSPAIKKEGSANKLSVQRQKSAGPGRQGNGSRQNQEPIEQVAAFQINAKEPTGLRSSVNIPKPVKTTTVRTSQQLQNSTSSPGLVPLKGKSLDVYTG
jgi:hypothetical protein